MVKVKAFPFLLLASLCVLIFSSNIYADPLAPPSFLTAISDQDGKVPLFWFKPNPDTFELSYDDGSKDHQIYVSPEWHHNCVAVKMTSTEVPFYLLKSEVFISYQGADIDSNYNPETPFFVTVNPDSGGIPKNSFLDSVLTQATGIDTFESDGEWVEVQHNLLMLDSLNFWIVFHWLEGSPMSPLVGADSSTNQGRSIWGMKNSPHCEWHIRSDYNIMIRAVIAINGGDSCEVDSFKIYRSETSFSISDTNLIGGVRSDQFQYIDTKVNNDLTYFYRLTSCSSGDQSDASEEVSATPKKEAILIADKNSFEVDLVYGDTLMDNLILTNSGGLPLEFGIEIDMEEQSWMGGADQFGYTWTDKNLQVGYDYSWIDIKDFGEEIGEAGDNDENYGFFSLGFSFPFYGSVFDSLRISTNGWISFTDTMNSIRACYVNDSLPHFWGPYNLIAPFWDDLIFSDSSEIYFYSNDSDSAIISFINLDHWITGGPYTFQTILNENGEMIFQYDTLGDKLNSATVGIQNWNGTEGLQIAYNQDYLEDSLWVRIRPSWISVDSVGGRIQPGESKTIDLTFDRLSYPQGIYHANLIINSRDKNHQLAPVEIPLTLYMDTTTSVDLDEDPKPIEFALFQNYPNPFNPATTFRFNIQGSKFKVPLHTTLKIYNVLGQRVKTLVDEPKKPGNYEVIWDGKDDKGKEVASGIYFYKLTVGSGQEVRKMVLLK